VTAVLQHQEGDCGSWGECRLCRAIGPDRADPAPERATQTRAPVADGVLRERKLGLLWFGERQEDRWSITDPHSDRLCDAAYRLRPESGFVGGEWKKFTAEEEQQRADLYVVLRAVEDYRHLTMYELGIEHIIKKLRVIWRALRDDKKKAPPPEIEDERPLVGKSMWVSDGICMICEHPQHQPLCPVRYLEVVEADRKALEAELRKLKEQT
jgi:hypothetical protein